MKMTSLQAGLKVLLVNWLVAPALGIWVWVKSDFLSCVAYFVIWLIADRVWDWLTRYLIAWAAPNSASEEEALQTYLGGEAPQGMAFMMLVDLLGTLILPWIVAGLFLAYI